MSAWLLCHPQPSLACSSPEQCFSLPLPPLPRRVVLRLPPLLSSESLFGGPFKASKKRGVVSPGRHCRSSCMDAMVLCPRGKFLPDSIQALLDPSCSIALSFNPCSVPPLLAAQVPPCRTSGCCRTKGIKLSPVLDLLAGDHPSSAPTVPAMGAYCSSSAHPSGGLLLPPSAVLPQVQHNLQHSGAGSITDLLPFPRGRDSCAVPA